MSSRSANSPPIGRAEQGFRQAFERLKLGRTMVLQPGARVSQNNVAKEAGRDPSALKKDRYPALVREIQQWIQDDVARSDPSPRQVRLADRSRNRQLREGGGFPQLERLSGVGHLCGMRLP